MSELGSFRTYLYWSERRILKLAKDNGIRLDPARPIEVQTPSIGLMPRLSRAFGSQALSRPDIAARMERAVGQLAVSDFVTPPPARFAKGTGTVTFSEFVGHGAEVGLAVASTSSTASDGSRTAVCLFGSTQNFAGMVTESGTRPAGWVSSEAPSVLRFIESRGEPQGWRTREWLARESFKIAFYQGEESFRDRVTDHPWLRGFTYGHVGDVCEWMADVFVDVLMSEELRDAHNSRFDRIVIGAPLWIRTPMPQALRRHDADTIVELSHRAAFVEPPPPRSTEHPRHDLPA